MKNIILLFLIALSAFAFNACNNSNAVLTAQNEIISFYNVPLVCSAAPDIGCGSRAKPALLEMENNPSIKEAWLNKQGTVYAIVWKEKEQTSSVAKPIFEENKISFTQISEKTSASYLENFRKENFWYRSSDVDKLSIQEASEIANRYVSLALEKNWITTEEANAIKPDVENYFKTELVKVRTVEELYSDSENKFRQDIVGIFTKHIGKEKTDKVVAMYNQWEKESKQKDACCKKPSSDKCCVKK